MQRGQACLRHGDTGSGEELPSLVEAKAQIRCAYLGKLLRNAQTMQPDLRVLTAGEYDLQQGWSAREQPLELRQRVGRLQLVKVIYDQYDWCLQPAQLLDQSLHQPEPVEVR